MFYELYRELKSPISPLTVLPAVERRLQIRRPSDVDLLVVVAGVVVVRPCSGGRGRGVRPTGPPVGRRVAPLLAQQHRLAPGERDGHVTKKWENVTRSQSSHNTHALAHALTRTDTMK